MLRAAEVLTDINVIVVFIITLYRRAKQAKEVLQKRYVVLNLVDVHIRMAAGDYLLLLNIFPQAICPCCFAYVVKIIGKVGGILVILQIIGLIVLSIISFVMFSLLLGIGTTNNRLDMLLLCVKVLFIFTSVNSLFFAGWIAIFNISNLYNIHTFPGSFQTLHFVIYIIVASLLLSRPLSVLMDKSLSFIHKLQWKLEERRKKYL